jgi:hypothetical protein
MQGSHHQFNPSLFKVSLNENGGPRVEGHNPVQNKELTAHVSRTATHGHYKTRGALVNIQHFAAEGVDNPNT